MARGYSQSKSEYVQEGSPEDWERRNGVSIKQDLALERHQEVGKDINARMDEIFGPVIPNKPNPKVEAMTSAELRKTQFNVLKEVLAEKVAEEGLREYPKGKPETADGFLNAAVEQIMDYAQLKVRDEDDYARGVIDSTLAAAQMERELEMWATDGPGREDEAPQRSYERDEASDRKERRGY